MKDAFVVVGLLTQYKGRKLHETRSPQKYRRWPCTAGLLEIRGYTLQSVLCWELSDAVVDDLVSSGLDVSHALDVRKAEWCVILIHTILATFFMHQLHCVLFSSSS